MQPLGLLGCLGALRAGNREVQAHLQGLAARQDGPTVRAVTIPTAGERAPGSLQDRHGLTVGGGDGDREHGDDRGGHVDVRHCVLRREPGTIARHSCGGGAANVSALYMR